MIRMPVPPATLSSFTGVSFLDTRVASGTVSLPAASTLYGRILTFKDQYGAFQTNPVTLSTIGTDRFEGNMIWKTLSTTNAYHTVIAGSDNIWYTIAQYNTQPSTLSLSTLVLENKAPGYSPVSLQFSTTSLTVNGQLFTTPLVAKYQVLTL